MRRKSLKGVGVGLVSALALVAPSVANANCKTFHHRAKIESGIFKTDLAYLYLDQRVCYNGHSITKVGRSFTHPGFTGNSIGMSFVGYDRKVRKYLRWRHHRNGSWYVEVAGTFMQTIGPYTNATHISCHMRIFGDGSVRKGQINA